MSKSEQWANRSANAAVSPLKFGATSSSIRRNAMQSLGERHSQHVRPRRWQSCRPEIQPRQPGRQPARRQRSQQRLAIQLDVDPYTDFPPLAERLQEMSRVMAGGQLTVRAGLAAVTGGIGMGLAAATSLEGAKETLRDKTAGAGDCRSAKRC
jgi:hypothetical protein